MMMTNTTFSRPEIVTNIFTICTGVLFSQSVLRILHRQSVANVYRAPSYTAYQETISLAPSTMCPQPLLYKTS